jgi:hypothetical protein
VTISNDLVSGSPWKVEWAQQVTNVTAGASSTITFSGTGSLTCTVSTTFVTQPSSPTLPVQWSAATFLPNAAGTFVSGNVLSATTTVHPVRITVAGGVSGVLTCQIDPDDSPGSTWTGKH